MKPEESVRRYNWRPAEGEWTVSKRTIIQKRIEGATRIYANVRLSDFVLETSFTITEAADNGEAKIIFSDAKGGEKYRIDFMLLGLCRVTAGLVSFVQPLEILRNRSHQVRIKVKNDILAVRVDGLDIISGLRFGKRSNGVVGLGTFLGRVSFTFPVIKAYRRGKCSVLMPYDEKRNFLYDYAIAPTLQNHPDFELEFSRADTLFSAGRITDDIREEIEKSDLILADVSVNEPNVYYEIGTAHGKGRDVVLMKERVEGQRLDLPFDIQHYRVYTYQFSRKGFEEFGGKLQQIVSR